MDIPSIPTDQRLRVAIHELYPETQSFISLSGLVSFIPDAPDANAKIEEIDVKIRQNYDRILESPPMMHVRSGHSLLAVYQDSYYRGFCLSTSPKEAEIWFADYGNISPHVAKTELRSMPKEIAQMPAVSLLGKLNVKNRSHNGDVENSILEDFNRKITMADDRKADVICSGSSRSPFTIYTIDVVFSGADSSFLNLLSNKSSLDWGLSFEVSPSKIELKRPNPPKTPAIAPARVIRASGSSESDPKILTENTSSLKISASKPSGATHDSAGASAILPPTTAPKAEQSCKYPPTIDGCHQRIDELELRLKIAEDKLKKLFPE